MNYLDMLTDLDAGSISKPGGSVSHKSEIPSPEERLAHYPELLAKMLGQVVSHNDSYAVWMGRAHAIKGAGLPFESFVSYSQKHLDCHDSEEDLRAKWDSIAPTMAGETAVLRMLDDLGINTSDYRAAAAQDLFTADPEPPPSVSDFLSVEQWSTLYIQPSVTLLGELLTTTARIFLVGKTGLGKSLLLYGMGAGMASGAGFLHWRSSRPARVLIVDGEMPSELIKTRVMEAVSRAGSTIKPGNLTIFARDSEEQFAKMFPHIGMFEPLNTPQGLQWLQRLIKALGGVDVILFDNVMSLISGDQKDEISWTGTLPLVQWLTSQQIGQVWADHTGHNTDRQYGSSTKAWRFDAVAVLTAVDAVTPINGGAVAFKLDFSKARRRTPQNYRDFETRVIRLVDGVWSSESAGGDAAKGLPHAQAEIIALITDAGGSLPESTLRARYARGAVGSADAVRMAVTRGLKALKIAGRVCVADGVISLPDAVETVPVAVGLNWHDNLLGTIQ